MDAVTGGDCGPLPGVLAGMNTFNGIQACGECNAVSSDPDAASALAHWVGGCVRFWQHDAELAAQFERGWRRDGVEADLWEFGFVQRCYARPARVDDCVLAGTEPWVEMGDGQPVNWVHFALFREARRMDRATPRVR